MEMDHFGLVGDAVDLRALDANAAGTGNQAFPISGALPVPIPAGVSARAPMGWPMATSPASRAPPS